MHEKRVRKGIKLSILSCLMAFIMVMTAFAAAIDTDDSYATYPAIDQNETGSITVSMNTKSDGTGDPIGGGTMTIYQVAEVVLDQDPVTGGYYFEVIDPFTGSSYNFEERIDKKTGDELEGEWAQLAQDFADFVYAEGIEGKTETIDSNGTVIFDGLYPGLYLLVQTQPADGYYASNPFLVSMPTYTEDSGSPEYTYQVDASPKTEALREYEQPGKDVDTDTEDDKDYGDDGVTVSVGQTLTYKITYTNYYAVPATVVITDALDENVEYVDDSASDGGIYDEETHTVTWTLSEVQAGYSGEVTFCVTVLSSARTPGQVENDADVYVGNDSAVKTNKVVNPVTPGTSTSHHSTGGGGGSGSGGGSGGGSGSGGPGSSGGSEGDSGGNVWDLLPLPQTGQGWAMMIAICALIVAGIGLIVAYTVRRKN